MLLMTYTEPKDLHQAQKRRRPQSVAHPLINLVLHSLARFAGEGVKG